MPRMTSFRWEALEAVTLIWCAPKGLVLAVVTVNVERPLPVENAAGLNVTREPVLPEAVSETRSLNPFSGVTVIE